ENLVGSGQEDFDAREERLGMLARQLAGDRGSVRIVYDSDPAAAIVRVAEDEGVDMVVVGNVGMGDRKQFLLGSVPNRISHNARCAVVIVNRSRPDGAGPTVAPPAPDGDGGPDEGALLRRAAQIGRVVARLAVRRGGGSTRSAAKGFRDALEELGPTFAK